MGGKFSAQKKIILFCFFFCICFFCFSAWISESPISSFLFVSSSSAEAADDGDHIAEKPSSKHKKKPLVEPAVLSSVLKLAAASIEEENDTNKNSDTQSLLSSLISFLTSPFPPSPAQSGRHRRVRDGRQCTNNNDTEPIILPPKNPYVSQGTWPVPHHDNDATASTDATGVSQEDNLKHSFLSDGLKLLNPIMLFVSNDGKSLWTSTWTTVAKINITESTLKIIDYAEKDILNEPCDVMHGAYSLLSAEDEFFMGIGTKLEAFVDVPNTEGKNIEKHEPSYDFSKDVPADPTGKRESIRGLCMTYDGYLAWVTSTSRAGVVKADLEEGFSKTEAYIDLKKVVGDQTLEMSNNIICDENNGIYIVSSKYLHKLEWSPDSKTLKEVWSSAYEVDESGTVPGRLGAGSGTTPTLIRSKEKNYVAITDAAKVMNLVIYDANNGEAIDQIPVTFGIANPESTLTEQSLLVSGHKIVAVNNTPTPAGTSPFTLITELFHKIEKYLPFGETIGKLLDLLNNVWPALVGDAPLGVQQFKFDPNTNNLCTTWTNADVSISNGIPAMSRTSGLMYGIGKRGIAGGRPVPYIGQWALQALNWEDGSLAFHHNMGADPLKNSLFAGAAVLDGAVYSGAIGGINRIGV